MRGHNGNFYGQLTEIVLQVNHDLLNFLCKAMCFVLFIASYAFAFHDMIHVCHYEIFRGWGQG